MVKIKWKILVWNLPTQFGGIKPITRPLSRPIFFLKLKDSPTLILSILFFILRCKVAYYANTSELSKRKASFGYGNKSDFTRTLTCSPPSTKYEHCSLFEKSKGKGKSFGLSREQSPDRSYLIPQLQRVPGPGKVKICLLKY